MRSVLLAFLLIAFGCGGKASLDAGTGPDDDLGVGSDLGAGSDAGADGGGGGMFPINGWRGYVIVSVSETADPKDTKMDVSAEALLLDVPQNEAERAAHQGERDYFVATRKTTPKGMCVAQGSVNPPVGVPRFANVGELAVRKGGVDVLTLMRLPEGQLGYQQKRIERGEAPFSVAFKNWTVMMAPVDVALGSNKATTVTTMPASDANARIKVTDGMSLLLRFSGVPMGTVPAVKTTPTRPGGPEYTCYGDDTGQVTIPPTVLGDFKAAAPAGTEFKLSLLTILLTGFQAENRSGVGFGFEADNGLFDGLLLYTGGYMYFYF